MEQPIPVGARLLGVWLLSNGDEADVELALQEFLDVFTGPNEVPNVARTQKKFTVDALMGALLEHHRLPEFARALVRVAWLGTA